MSWTIERIQQAQNRWDGIDPTLKRKVEFLDELYPHLGSSGISPALVSGLVAETLWGWYSWAPERVDLWNRVADAVLLIASQEKIDKWLSENGVNSDIV
jgi:hypothetical protein